MLFRRSDRFITPAAMRIDRDRILLLVDDEEK
jgi:hypothetical protein